MFRSCVLPSGSCLLPTAFCFLPFCASLVARLESVTDPRLGEDVFWVGRIRLELFAKLSDKDAEIFSLFSVIAAPDRAEQFVMGEYGARMLDHKKQKFELLRCQMYLASFDQGLVSCRINLKI